MQDTLIFIEWPNPMMLNEILESLNINAEKKFRESLLTFLTLKLKKTKRRY